MGLEGPYSLYGLWASHGPWAWRAHIAYMGYGPAMGQPWASHGLGGLRRAHGPWAGPVLYCIGLYIGLYGPWAGPAQAHMGPYGPIWAMAHMGHMGLYGPGPAQQALQW